MERCCSSMDVQIAHTPRGNYYTMHGPCERTTISAADQAQERQIVGQQHARVRVPYVGYDMRAGRQRSPHCTTGVGRALWSTPLRFVWYGPAQQMVLVIGVRAYRWRFAEKTLSALLLRGVALTPDWERLRHEPALHPVVDEHSFAGKDLVITVAEARTRQVLAMLRDDRRPSLQPFLSSIPPTFSRASRAPQQM